MGHHSPIAIHINFPVDSNCLLNFDAQTELINQGVETMNPMHQPTALQLQTISITKPAQGTLFALAMLPRQPRSYKSELEQEFLPPREQRLSKQLPH